MNRRRTKLVAALCLLAAPPMVLLAAQVLGGIASTTAARTFGGMVSAAIGGLITGVISERFLNRGRSGVEQTAGLIAATAASVITIGILYLLQIRGPMSSIGTPDRATVQLFGFVEFLAAQGAGILLSAGLLMV